MKPGNTRGARMMQRQLVPALLLVAALLPLAGCGNQEPSPVKATPISTEDQIKAIQNDPKMTPEAKAAAIQSLQRGQAMGAAMGQTLRNQK